MKLADVRRLQTDGLISVEQRDAIVARYRLEEESSRLLVILGFLGGILVVAGVALLISANWEDIPRLVKLAAGLGLMLGAHGLGWRLRQRNYPKLGEALHFAGAGMFLANIALVGQIYPLSSRPANVFLLWWAGIAALPWLLRSKALHVLALLAFGTWFGVEAGTESSWFFVFDETRILSLLGLLGLVYIGVGLCLRGTSFRDFAPATEKLGLLAVNLCCYPLTWELPYFHRSDDRFRVAAVLLGLAVPGMVLAAFGLRRLDAGLSRQWRWTWGLALAGVAAMLVAGRLLGHESDARDYSSQQFAPFLAFMFLGLFVFCLLQIQVGLLLPSTFYVNLSMGMIILLFLRAYVGLFGTMQDTGLVFLTGGVLLIALGYGLERKRRQLIRQVRQSHPEATL